MTAAVTQPTDGMTASSERLRVLFVTEDDPLYVIRFFEVFFAEFPRDRFEIVGVTVQDAFHEPITKTARRMWRFYGPVDFTRMGARFALTKIARTSIARLAEQYGFGLLPTQSVNDADYIEQVKSLHPDVIVSVAAPEIFRKNILAAAPNGCINIHSGRLPKYRGMMPNFWQMLNGEEHATITVHEMAAKLDAGRVLATQDYPIKTNDSLDRVITETKRAGARLMIDVLQNMQDDALQPQEVDMADADYFSFPTPDDVRAFRRSGHRML